MMIAMTIIDVKTEKREKNGVRTFHGDASELDDIDEDYDNGDSNDEFDIRILHGDTAEPDVY